MGRIQSSVGLITGVAIEDTVNKLMQLNAFPRDRLVSRGQGIQQEQVALTELTALVVGVQLTTDRLGQASLFSATKVTSNKTDLLGARRSGSPKPGNYSFIPVQQAQSQQLTSSLFSSTDQKVGAGELVIHTGGFLDESVNLDELNAGAGIARGRIRITDRSGSQQTIDLRFAQTANDVVEAINSSDNLNVVASLQGDRFVLTDSSGSTSSNLKVEEVGGGQTAAGLGLGGINTSHATATGSSIQSLSNNSAIKGVLDGRGLDLRGNVDLLQFNLSDGSNVKFKTELKSGSASVGQLVSELNAAGEGKFQVRIKSDGSGLEVEDLTSGAQAFSVIGLNGELAQQLGFERPAVGNTISGERLISGLSDVLLSSLNGGKGFAELGEISLTDRSGAAATVDLSAAETLQQVIDTINDSGVGVRAGLNRSKTGIEIVDTTGLSAGELKVENGDNTDSATLLKIEGSTTSGSINSGSLNRQFVGRNTELDQLNGGPTFPLSSIRLTDSAGKSANLTLGTLKPKTVGEVIDAVNRLGIGLSARINDAGDGILIVDTAQGTGEMIVADLGSGTSANLLGIAGTATDLTVGGQTVKGLDGSRTLRISTNADATLAELVESVNNLGNGPVSASTLNLSTTGGVRLLLSSTSTGTQGRVAIDSDLGFSFSETSQARDALISFGGNESSGGVLISSTTNTFRGVVDDLEFTINGTSETAVSVSVTETSETLSKQLETFVDQFNKLREKLDTFTSFDATANTVGILFGTSSVLRIEGAYARLFTGVIRGAGDITSLNQLGVRLNDTGNLEFDEAKFAAALETDPTAVREFFTKEDAGFSARAKAIADGLAGVDGGLLLTRSNSLQTQIEQNARRVDSFNVRLDRQRTRLLTQFYGMERAIAKLQTNLTALNQLQIIPPLSQRA